MAEYPSFLVRPSAVSAPAVIDSMLSYQTDQGYEVRRAEHSRPRRRWTLSYLGKTVDEMRLIRDFLQQQRLGALDFVWQHPTATDRALFDPTTPVTVRWRHGLFTGMWVAVGDTPNPGINNQAWQITRIDELTVTLTGTVAAGIAGNGDVRVWVPHAVGLFQSDTMESPETVIGPEQVPWVQRRSGVFSFSVTIEETF